jgi:CRP/FNR family transcriptional regulator
MTPDDLERIAGLTTAQHYRAGDTIIAQGTFDKQLFVIVEGRVHVMKAQDQGKPRRVRTMMPFNYFGEMALIDDMVRSASVVAETDTTVLVLQRWNLRKEIERYPALAMELMKMLSRRIRAIEKCLWVTMGASLPICVHCRRICEGGLWIEFDQYLQEHADTELSQSIFPDCSRSMFPRFYETP